MNESAEYLDQFARLTSDIREATVIAVNRDGTYKVETIDSRAQFDASLLNPRDRPSVRARVMVQLPSASRTVLGAQAVITGRAPMDQRGLSETVPLEESEAVGRALIRSVDPDPLILYAGGEEGVQIIRGIRFTEVGTYSKDGITPNLSQSAPPTITDEIVTMTVAADLDSPLGDFDLHVGDAVAPNALRIISAGTPVLFVPGDRVYAVNVLTGALTHQSPLLPTPSNRTFAVAPDTIIAFYAAGGAAVTTRKLAALASYDPPTFPPVNQYAQIADDRHGAIWYGSGNTLYSVSISTGAATPIHAAAGSYEGVTYDVKSDSVFACAKDSQAIRQFARSTMELSHTYIANGLGALIPRNLDVFYGEQLVAYFAGPHADPRWGYQSFDLRTRAPLAFASESFAPSSLWPLGQTARSRDRYAWLVGVTDGITYAPTGETVLFTMNAASELTSPAILTVFSAEEPAFAVGMSEDHGRIIATRQEGGTQLKVFRGAELESVSVDPAVPVNTFPSAVLPL